MGYLNQIMELYCVHQSPKYSTTHKRGMCGLYKKGIGEIGVDDCNSVATVKKMVI